MFLMQMGTVRMTGYAIVRCCYDNRIVVRLLLQLDETAGNFDAFWTSHRHRLEQCLQLRHFEEQFKQVMIQLTS